MSDDWHFYPCTMGTDRAFIFFDYGIRESIDLAPKQLAVLRLKYKTPNENGLPTNAEFPPVSTIEDRLVPFSEKHGGYFVGRITVQGHRYFYVYLNDVSPLEGFAGEISADFDYQIEFSMRDDAKHEGYWNELFPTDDDWQVIMDLQVLENLEKHGDDGSTLRIVEHWSYFSDEHSANAFVQWAVADRFTYQPQYSGSEDDGRRCIRLSHTGTLNLDDITSHTIALRRKASELGGEYDGWEVPVVKSYR